MCSILVHSSIVWLKGIAQQGQLSFFFSQKINSPQEFCRIFFYRFLCQLNYLQTSIAICCKYSSKHVQAALVATSLKHMNTFSTRLVSLIKACKCHARVDHISVCTSLKIYFSCKCSILQEGRGVNILRRSTSRSNQSNLLYVFKKNLVSTQTHTVISASKNIYNCLKLNS